MDTVRRIAYSPLPALTQTSMITEYPDITCFSIGTVFKIIREQDLETVDVLWLVA